MSALHGTAIARMGRGALLIGKSGSGKSSLAFQLMALGADLVADDAVYVEASDEGLMLKCPDSTYGMIEARGIGLISLPAVAQARLAFVVDLDKTAAMRLPNSETYMILGQHVPLIPGKNLPDIGAVIWCLLGNGRLIPQSES